MFLTKNTATKIFAKTIFYHVSDQNRRKDSQKFAD